MEPLEYHFPFTEIEFDVMFSTEEACEKYLFDHKWPDGFVCSKCGHRHSWRSSRRLYVCSKCGFNHSVTQGTIMENTHKPLMYWFKAIWLYTTRKSGFSAKDLQRLLGVTYQTAWSWMQKLRRGSTVPEREQLSGDVEVDEFYYGGQHKGKAGRGSENKTVVIVAVEKITKEVRTKKNKTLTKVFSGRTRMQVIENCSKENIEDFINQHIKQSSTIHSDGWKSYGSVGTNGYAHIVSKNKLPYADRVISLFKRHMLGTYHGRPEHKYLSQYLEEFTFRFNRKTAKSMGLLFQRIMWLSTVVGYRTTKQIITSFT